MARVKPVRLQKYLAQCGLCSRRTAEQWIAAGRIAVDGRVVTEMGVTIQPESQHITCDGKVVTRQEKHVYLLLNKPKGFVTTVRDPQGRPTVISLLKGVTTRVFPVGRLDLDTEGALLLTNDGGLAQRIQHPSHRVHKTYQALVSGHPSSAQLQQLARGVKLEGRMTAPARVRRLSRHQENSLIELRIHEGRKRQVKKMCGLIGHPVISLKRTAYGKLDLGHLAIGEYRQLNPADLKKIFL